MFTETRNVMLWGKRTTFKLEPDYWAAIVRQAADNHLTINEYISIHVDRWTCDAGYWVSMASKVRVGCMVYEHNRFVEKHNRVGPETLTAIRPFDVIRRSKNNLRLFNRRTTLWLEDQFWHACSNLAQFHETSIDKLIERQETRRPGMSRAAAIRCEALNTFYLNVHGGPD